MRWSVINICLLCHLGPISQTSSSPRSNSMEISSTPTPQTGTLWSSIFAWSLGSYRKFTCSLVSWLGTHICVIDFMIPIDLCLVRAAFGFLLPQSKSVDGTFMFFAFFLHFCLLSPTLLAQFVSSSHPGLGWLYVFSSFPPRPPRPHPRPRTQKLFPLKSKQFELNLSYFAQRIYGSGEIYWMTFPWPWPKACGVF